MKKVIIIVLVLIAIIVGAIVLILNNRQSLENKILNEAGNGAKPIAASEGFAGGTGSLEDPYQISNINELQYMSDLFNANKTSKEENEKYAKSYYVLTNDITLNSDEEMAKINDKAPTYRWDAIGTAKGIDTYYFSGVLDGQNHTISGLYNYVYKGDSAKDTNYLGLFSQIVDAEIKNLNIKNSYFVVEKGALATGSLAGFASNSKISNINIINTYLNTTSCSTGGLIGRTVRGASITNVQTAGTINCKASRAAGLIASVSDGGTIDNCINNINITVTDETHMSGSASGIIDALGDNSKKSLKITNCTNNGEIKGQAGDVSGVLGDITKDDEVLTIENCKNTAKIENTGAASGIIHKIYTSNSLKDSLTKTLTINNVENSGEIKSKQNVGGIIAEISGKDNTNVEIKNATNNGNLEAQIVGGILSNLSLQNKANVLIENCTNTGSLKCTEYYLGGIVGRLNYTPNDITDKTLTIKNCTNNGEINAGSVRTLGGIFGIYETANNTKNIITIESCTNNANINGETPTWMAGIACYVQDKDADVTLNIKSCTNNGQFNFNVTSHENQDPEKEKGTAWKNYAGGIAAIVCKKTNIENNTNNGNLNEAGINFEGVKFDNNYCYQAE